MWGCTLNISCIKNSAVFGMKKSHLLLDILNYTEVFVASFLLLFPRKKDSEKDELNTY